MFRCFYINVSAQDLPEERCIKPFYLSPLSGSNVVADLSTHCLTVISFLSECGIRAVNGSNITGAHDAAPGSWPWFANVHLVYGGSVTDRVYCAGSLITDQWVLTRGFLPE